MKYRLVNNTEMGIRGCYYGGPNKKYWDMFDITVSECAKVFDTIKEAEDAQAMLKRRFQYEHFEIEGFIPKMED